MKKATPFVVLGLLLAALGAAGLVYEGVTYQDEEVVLDLGSVEASVASEERVSIPPLVSGGVLVLGLGLAAVGVTRAA